MNRFIDLPGDNRKYVYLPNPTWGNHNTIFQDSGFACKAYKYYDEKTCGLDFKGLSDDVKVVCILFFDLTSLECS
jgi:aspartate/tyrosine/aromatic aminotransferase